MSYTDPAVVASLPAVLAAIGQPGGPASVAALSDATGIPRNSLSYHRVHCLGLPRLDPNHAILSARAAATASQASGIPSLGVPVGGTGSASYPAGPASTPRTDPALEPARLAHMSHHGTDAPPAAIVPTLGDTSEARASLALSAADEERVTVIADMVRYVLWKNRGTVLAMASKWGVTEREVNRLHRIACRRLANARGGATARREHSVAVCTKIRDDELTYAESKDREADAHMSGAEPNVRMARTCKTMSAIARQVALGAQRQIDLWDQKTASFTLNVNAASEHPDFAATYDTIGRMLDAWVPGLKERVLEGLEVLEEKGQAAFDEFVAETRGDLHAVTVEAGAC